MVPEHSRSKRNGVVFPTNGSQLPQATQGQLPPPPIYATPSFESTPSGSQQSQQYPQQVPLQQQQQQQQYVQSPQQQYSTQQLPHQQVAQSQSAQQSFAMPQYDQQYAQQQQVANQPQQQYVQPSLQQNQQQYVQPSPYASQSPQYDQTPQYVQQPQQQYVNQGQVQQQYVQQASQPNQQAVYAQPQQPQYASQSQQSPYVLQSQQSPYIAQSQGQPQFVNQVQQPQYVQQGTPQQTPPTQSMQYVQQSPQYVQQPVQYAQPTPQYVNQSPQVQPQYVFASQQPVLIESKKALPQIPPKPKPATVVTTVTPTSTFVAAPTATTTTVIHEKVHVVESVRPKHVVLFVKNGMLPHIDNHNSPKGTLLWKIHGVEYNTPKSGKTEKPVWDQNIPLCNIPEESTGVAFSVKVTHKHTGMLNKKREYLAKAQGKLDVSCSHNFRINLHEPEHGGTGNVTFSQKLKGGCYIKGKIIVNGVQPAKNGKCFTY